ncbi:MAG: hypothetical protein JRJ85_04940 [Deltaproteobacteria bacterium]|nr:hypothetical protein [Deltaproteobacteria bacterium]
MKVHENQGPVLEQAQQKLKRKDHPETDFRKIMDQTLQEKPVKDHMIVPGNLPMISGGVAMIRGPESHDSPLNTSETKKLVSTIRDTLDMIDFYAAKLSDASVPSRDMTPLINYLEDRMDSLQGMESVPSMPDKLRSIVSDVVITVGTEIAKFRRGDYA